MLFSSLSHSHRVIASKDETVPTSPYLSTVTDIRWQTIDAEMKRDICSSVTQIADWRIILHVINSGTDTRPVSRSDKARLPRRRLVLERKYRFHDIKTNTKELTKIINTASTSGTTSALGSKNLCISSEIQHLESKGRKPLMQR